MMQETRVDDGYFGDTVSELPVRLPPRWVVQSNPSPLTEIGKEKGDRTGIPNLFTTAFGGGPSSIRFN